MIKMLFFLFIIADANDTLRNFLIEKGIIDKQEYENYAKKENKYPFDINSLITVRYCRQEKIYPDVRNVFLVQFKTHISKNLNENSKINIGFATGERTRPRSNFESLSGGFNNKNLNINILNFLYSNKFFSFSIGKFQNNLWISNSALIDTDITLEGAYLEVKNKSVWLSYDYLILQEFSQTKKDPILNIAQAGFKTSFLKLAFTYYDFLYIKNTSTSTFTSRPNNTYLLSNTSLNSRYKYDYNILSSDIKTEIKTSKNTSFVSYLNLGKNITISKNSKFKIYGFEFNINKNNSKFISLNYNYRKFQDDSFLDILPDVASYGGSTGIKSYRFFANINITKNVCFVPYYIYSEPLKSQAKDERMFLVDWIFKF